MTWTYDEDQSTPKDHVRWVIGDTDNDRQLVSDEEIDAVLERKNGDVTRAAIELAEHLEAKFVRRAESRSGDIIADFLTVASKYAMLAKRLRKRGLKGFAYIYTGDRQGNSEQTTKIMTEIRLNDFDDPEAS